MNNCHAGIENLRGYILACSKFIALALIIHFVSGCSNSVYPTSNIATELSPDKISHIMEYEINNSISYKGFCGCENFYDLYNKLNDEVAKMKATDKALLSKITYRDCVNAAIFYAEQLESTDVHIALDATAKEYPLPYCFLMGGDWQFLIIGNP